MANLFFPQLASGAVAQYPIVKTKQIRSVQNVYADGNVIACPDSHASALEWQLTYSGLSCTDLNQLQSFFAQCCGSFRAFTFIDPTANMLDSSSDLSAKPWITDSGLVITPGVEDPVGGKAAFQLANTSQGAVQIAQTINVPGAYQYCLSAYLRTANGGSATLGRTAGAQTSSVQLAPTSTWQRFVSSGRLSDTGTSVTVFVSLAPGQAVDVFGPQLEPQIAPSSYCPTTTNGGVYPNCHFGVDAFPIAAEAPGAFATALTIQTLI